MTETKVRIAIPGTELHIAGVLRETPERPLLVIVPGLDGDMLTHPYWTAFHELARRGFSTFRFGLFGWGSTRKLLDCTLATFAHDIDLIVSFFKNQQPMRPIAVIGHSLGALGALHSIERRFDATVLWDPSRPEFGDFESRSDEMYRLDEETWVVCAGYRFMISERMGKSIRQSAPGSLLRNFERPLLIIGAGDGELVETCHEYHSLASEPKELRIIEGASHYFNEADAAIDLFHTTAEFLDKHL